jgi:tetratricopeptide (TPR) repeat protein
MQNNTHSTLLYRIATWSLYLMPLVALLAFVPVRPFVIDGTKVLSFIVLTLVSAIAYFGYVVKEKKVTLPHARVLLGSGVFVGALLTSTLFSHNALHSVFGIGTETWSLVTLTLLVLYTLLVSTYAREEKVRSTILALLGASAAIALLFHAARLISNGVVSLSIFNQDIVLNTLGRWYDFGFVAVLLVVASSMYVVTHAITYVKKILGWAVVLFGLFVWTITTSLLNTILLAVGLVYVYMYALKNTGVSVYESVSKFVVLALAVFSGLFFIFQLITAQSPLFFQGSQVPNLSGTRYQIVYRDYPTTFLSDSWYVAVGAVRENPVFGTGFAHYATAWNMYKPSTTNATPFWASDFTYGAGILLTLLTMTGILGTLGLLVWLGSSITVAWRFRHNTDSRTQKTVYVLTILSGIYAFIHTPSIGLLLVIGTLLGLTLSYAPHTEYVKAGKYWNLVQGIVALALVGIIVFVGMRVYTLGTAMRALRDVSTPSALLEATKTIEPIANKNANPLYVESLVALYQTRASQIAQEVQSKEKNLSENDKQALITEFQTLPGKSIQALDIAIARNPKVYTLYVQKAQILGNVLASVGESSRGNKELEQTYQAALSTLAQARTLAPLNPNIDILEAQIHSVQNKPTEARARLVDAINKRPAYTEPIALLAQLQLSQGDVQSARLAAQAGLRVDASNPQQALYVYGQVEKEAKNYTGAAQAFEQLARLQGNAVSPVVVRLLADSYVQVGDVDRAKEIYTQLLKLNPQDTEVQKIMDALNAPPQVPTPAPRSRR